MEVREARKTAIGRSVKVARTWSYGFFAKMSVHMAMHSSYFLRRR